MLITAGTSILTAKERERKSWGVAPLPIVAYSPDYGGMFGAVTIFFYGPDVCVPEDKRFRRDNSRSGNQIPRSYFGIGPDAGPDDEETFTSRSLGAGTNFNVQAAKDLFIGPLFRYEYVSITERGSAGAFDSGLITE